MRTKQLFKIAANIAFIVVFIYLAQKFASFDQLIATLQKTPFSNILLGVSILFITYILRAHRFFVLLKSQNVPWSSVLRVMLQHNAINNLLPFRLGELSFPILLKKQNNIKLMTSSKVLVTARLFDLMVMGGISLTLLIVMVSPNQRLALLVALVVACLGFAFAVFILRKSKNTVIMHIRTLFSFIATNAKTCTHLTLLIWTLKITGLALILAPMLNTHIQYALLAVLVVEGTAILPVNGPANFGSLEGAVVAVLLPFGLAAEGVFNAVLNLHILIIMLAAIGYVVSLFIPHSTNK